MIYVIAFNCIIWVKSKITDLNSFVHFLKRRVYGLLLLFFLLPLLFPYYSTPTDRCANNTLALVLDLLPKSKERMLSLSSLHSILLLLSDYSLSDQTTQHIRLSFPYLQGVPYATDFLPISWQYLLVV